MSYILLSNLVNESWKIISQSRLKNSSTFKQLISRLDLNKKMEHLMLNMIKILYLFYVISPYNKSSIF